MYRYLFNTNIETYNFMNTMGFVVLLLFNLSQVKKKKGLLSYPSQFAIHKISTISENKTLTSYIPWAIIETILISLVQYAFTEQINRFMGDITNTDSNYFGLLFITPILLILFCTLLRINPLKQIDIITPAFPLALVFAKLGCFGAGCCYGAAWEYGFYSERRHRTEYPAQLIEAAIALLLFIVLMLIRKKLKNGTLFPTYLTLYCATRFFSEFTKGDANTFGLLKTYQILCLIGLVVGIIELLFVLHFSEQITAFFDKHQFAPDRKLKKEKEKKLQKNKNR